MRRMKKSRPPKNKKNQRKKSAPPVNVQPLINQALQYHKTGNLGEAEKTYRQALQIDPNNAQALHLTGVIALQGGRFADAADLIGKAIARKPDYLKAYNNLGGALLELDRLEEAADAFRKATELDPGYVEAHNNLGKVLAKQDKPEQAAESFRQVIALQPDFVEAHVNLGNALSDLEQYDQATAHFLQALDLDPRHADARYNLGNAWNKMERLEDALSNFQQAVALKPNFPEAHYNLGIVLNKQKKPDEALKCFQQALTIKSDYAEAHYNMGTTQMDLSRALEAAESFRRTLEFNPDYDMAHSNLIFLQDLMTELDQKQQQEERQRWNETFIVSSADKIKPHTNDKTPERRLRVGYVSGDFRRHSASQGFAPLILEHDRDRFDVICYDNNPSEDETATLLRNNATEWREVRKMDDDELAETIRGDAIDILVDLAAHTRDNRLKVFGHKPAPVQVCGIGHLAPGLSTVDYRLTTPILTPPEEEALYPEQPIYLKTYFGLTPPENAPPTSTLPCLEKGFFTYGFLGRHTKITPQVVETWARILRDTPNSRLLLKHRQLDTPTDIDRTLEDFSKLGIAADRFILLGSTDHAAHLRTHNHVDIVLDTFPHGGGITALESLWMGVPLVGINDPGKAGGRIPAMISEPLGLGDFVTDTPETYYRVAREWNQRTDDLSRIRESLRDRLVDLYESFPNDIEKAYRKIWTRWCKGDAPSPLHVDDSGRLIEK